MHEHGISLLEFSHTHVKFIGLLKKLKLLIVDSLRKMVSVDCEHLKFFTLHGILWTVVDVSFVL